MGAEAVLGQLNGAADKAEAFPGQLNGALDALNTKINSLMADVPGWLSDMLGWIWDKIKWLWDKIVELAKKLSDWVVKNVWPVIKGPWTLYDASNKWTTDVFHRTSTVSGNINTSKTTLDDWWQGAAATAYIQITPVQKAAVDKASEIATKVKDTLQSLTFALAGVYIAVVALLMALLLSIPPIAAAIASIVGIPAGLVGTIAEVLLAIGGAAALYAGVKIFADNALGTFGTLLQLQDDNSAFENGHWPKSAKAVSEIGDGSNWHYKG